jgi:hypothetical protein
VTPLSAPQALEQFYIEARCRLLDLAAILDRVDRGGEVNDPRRARIDAAIALLAQGGPGRAAAIQELFSLPYDPAWVRPEPR